MKEMEPACTHLYEIAQMPQHAEDIMSGKTVLTLKAICAIYANMVNKVAAGADESAGIAAIKEKINDQSNILAQHQISAKNRIAQNSKAMIRDGMVSYLDLYRFRQL